jgi:anti-sigma factor RsiW
MAGGGACVPLAEALPHVIDTAPPPEPRPARMGRGTRGCSIPITGRGRAGYVVGGCRGSLLLRFLTGCLLLPAGSPVLPPAAAAAALGFGPLGGLGSAVDSKQIHAADEDHQRNKHATEGTCGVLMQ